MKTAICPNCAIQFKPSDNRAYKGIVKDYRDSMKGGHKAFEKWIDESSMVRCPNCGDELKSGAIGDIRRICGLQNPNYLIAEWHASKSLHRPVRRGFSEDVPVLRSFSEEARLWNAEP